MSRIFQNTNNAQVLFIFSNSNMLMDWFYPERAEMRDELEKLRRENRKLWGRVQTMESRFDRVSIEQFLFTYSGDEKTMSSTTNILKRFGVWVTR